MKTVLFSLLAIAFLGLLATPVFAVKGEWHTDPDRALAAAVKSKTPILAVAMDHG
jgi:hypothetical protein